MTGEVRGSGDRTQARLGAARLRSAVPLLGYAVVVCQWITNNRLGAGWPFPADEAAAAAGVIGAGQMALWVAFLVSSVLCALATVRTPRPLADWRSIVAAATALVMAGLALVYVCAGLWGNAEPAGASAAETLGGMRAAGYIVGMASIGVGNAALTVAWGERLCAAGLRAAALALAASFVAGAALFACVQLVGVAHVGFAMILQVAIVPLCALGLQAAGSLVPDTATGATPPPSLGASIAAVRGQFMALLPFFATVALFGVFGGALGSLLAATGVSSAPFAWMAGIAAVGLALLVATLLARDVSLTRLSAFAVPVLAAGVMLVALLPHNAGSSLPLVGLICLCSVYTRMFYTLACVDLARAWLLPAGSLMASALAVETLGSVAGGAAVGLLPAMDAWGEAAYIVAVILAVLTLAVGAYSLRESNVASLWGLLDRVPPARHAAIADQTGTSTATSFSAASTADADSLTSIAHDHARDDRDGHDPAQGDASHASPGTPSVRDLPTVAPSPVASSPDAPLPAIPDSAPPDPLAALFSDAGLTPRETDVAMLLAEGLTADAIAERLVVSIATVRTHTRNAYAKLDVHSQPELIRLAVYGRRG